MTPCKSCERLETALQIVRTWASNYFKMPYGPLKNVEGFLLNLCDEALKETEEKK